LAKEGAIMADPVLTEEQKALITKRVEEVKKIEQESKEIIENHPSGVGRPSTITEDSVSKLIACFNVGLGVTTACQHARISREAYYRRMDSDMEFRNKMIDAQNYLKIIAGQKVWDIIHKGADRDRVRLLMWYLEHKEREEFGNVQNTLVQNNITYVPPSWFHPDKIAEKTASEQAAQKNE
jgi:hypothetical protein